ncbi:hypothetical protein I79_021532 [Cricetulus griseus]|uniref:Uncharacterized protein n=1 Tax=Cricetulus griseus TaxID=10029 RepID=G3ICX7_CRIGR|nr:hypothetical protein I79_021532 [Cricetulus griseus]
MTETCHAYPYFVLREKGSRTMALYWFFSVVIDNGQPVITRSQYSICHLMYVCDNCWYYHDIGRSYLSTQKQNLQPGTHNTKYPK